MKFKTLFKIVLCGLSIYLCTWIYEYLTDDFRLTHIRYDEFPIKPEWRSPVLGSEEFSSIEKILDQKFSYLGKGAQSYAFTSEDGNYVLKFFKFKNHKPGFYVKCLPSFSPFKEIREEKLAKHKRKLDSAFNGYKIAYDLHREGTGLEYIHLSQTDFFNKSVTVKDKMGFTKHIDLDPVVFIIQKKAIMTKDALNESLSAGDLDLTKSRIKQLFDLYHSEYQRGMYDRDRRVMKNSGFIEDRAIRFDVGKLTLNESMVNPSVYHNDLEDIFGVVDQWVKDHYPHYHPEISQFISKLLS